MKIGFIGAGKVGFSLGKYFVNHGKCVIGYFSRNLDSSKDAAMFTNSKYYDNLDELVAACEVIFLTVPDGSIRETYKAIEQLDVTGKCFVHCSGVLTSEVFEDISSKGARGCSLHPLCAVNDKYTGYMGLKDTYFTVEGQNTEDIVKLISECGNPIEVIAKADKVKYHAAAVYASNLVVGLYDMASELLKDCNLSDEFAEHALGTLFEGNAHNITSKGVIGALTGPVERADATTVKKHMDTLDDDKREIYRLLSHRLIDIAQEKNPDRGYTDTRKELR